ncbi:hypothetical protein [Cupriavidus basilensis]
MNPIPDGFANIVLSQLVRTEIQNANKALVRALVTAADAGTGLTPDVIGVPRETLELFAKARPVQLDAVYRLGLPLWDFRFASPELAKALLNGEAGSTEITHRFLSGLVLDRTTEK